VLYSEPLVILILVLLLAFALFVVILQSVKLAKRRGEGHQSLNASLMGSSPPSESASDALFATLSHELRTPLNGLLGIVQMLNEEREDEDLQAIEGCARHMLAVVNTMVNHSKIQESWDDLPEYREWVSLYELLEQIKKNMAFRAGLRGLDIELVHEDRRLRLRGDRDHLCTIIENALLGSLESVSLVEIPKEQVKLRVAWEADGQNVKLTITNPLETYSENRAEKIHDACHLTTGENHARIKIQYLYWAVSIALLEKYSGALYPTQDPKGGVQTALTFEIEQMRASASDKLPIGGLSINSGPMTSKAVAQLPVTLSILVAEDDPIMRNLMETVFQHMGQEVDFATNGREVLDRVSLSPTYDVILMDIDMPIMDGVSASIALRNGESGEFGTRVPIVAVTAFNTLSDESKFRRAGMDYYLPKPVRLKNLREVLLDVIRKDGLTNYA
jgi:CheY-like chemotaxis protein